MKINKYILKDFMTLFCSSRDLSKCSPVPNWVFIVDIKYNTWRRLPDIPIDYFNDMQGIEIDATLSIHKSGSR